MSNLQLHAITLENVNILQLITSTILITPTLVLIFFHILVLQEYLVLMKSRILLKPVLGGLRIVSHSISSHEQTQ